MNDVRDDQALIDSSWRLLRRLGAVLATTLGGASAAIAVVVGIQSWWRTRVPLPILLLVALLILAIATFISVISILIFRRAAYRNDILTGEVEALKKVAREYHNLAYVDAITGISNTNKLKDVFETTERFENALIFIDLMEFRSVNGRYSHWLGNQYLREFAQFLQNSGRRDESIFKYRPLQPGATSIGTSLDAPPSEAYRMTAGGDEFFILIHGGIVEAIGYLMRLKRQLATFDATARGQLGIDRVCGFYAGVMTLQGRADFGNTVEVIAECLRIAHESSFDRSVYWRPEEIAMARGIYPDIDSLVRQASKEFAK